MSIDERFDDAKLDEIVSILDEGVNYYAESSLWYDSKLAEAADEASDAIGYLRRKLGESERRRETVTRRFIPFNTNSYVRVRLTDHGRAIHRKQFDQLRSQMSPTATIEYRPPKEDADGWSEWQMWDLMSRFGEHIGLCRPMVFLTEIEIQVVEQR